MDDKRLLERDPVFAEMEEQMMQNHSEMAQITHTIDTVFILYAGTCIFYALATLFLIVMLMGQDFFYMLMDGIFLKLLLTGLVFLSCYKHKSFYAVMGMILQIAMIAAGVINSGGSLLESVIFDISLLIAFIFVIYTGIIAVTNSRYNYLKKQPGFPYFNIRIEEYKRQRRIDSAKDPYEKRKNELQRNRSEIMVWVDKNARSDDTGRNDCHSAADMDVVEAPEVPEIPGLYPEE